MALIKISNISKAYNSKLLKISVNNKAYVIKLFSKKNKSNFIREVYFLLNFQNLQNIPKIISYEYKEKILVLNYCKGIKITKKQSSYIYQILSFLRKIQVKKKNYSLKGRLLKSREGCFCFLDHIKNTKQKIDKIKKNKALIKNSKFIYFTKKIDEIFKNRRNKILLNYKKKFLSKKFKLSNLIVSPSDFGYNNILLNSNKLVFLDFEYSGLDDPLKLCLDFLANPNTKFNKSENEAFLKKFSNIFKMLKLKKRFILKTN